jgi:hypothetical protein
LGADLRAADQRAADPEWQSRADGWGEPEACSARSSPMVPRAEGPKGAGGVRGFEGAVFDLAAALQVHAVGGADSEAVGGVGEQDDLHARSGAVEDRCQLVEPLAVGVA